MGRLKIRRSRNGLTLAELIISTTAVGVMILIVIPLFNITGRDTTPLEAGTLLSEGAQRATTDMLGHLSGNKRLFGNDAQGASFLARVTPSLSPAPLAGTLLPAITTGTLPASSETVKPADVGNSLFFAGAAPAVELRGLMDGLGTASSIRLNAYVFNYYYLAPDADRTIGGKAVRDLWEWHSAPYVDYRDLVGLADATRQHNAIAALLAPPNNIRYAFDPSTQDAASAFTQLSESSPWLSPVPVHHIVPSASGKMIILAQDAKNRGFTYSISPNTGGAFTHRYPVPAYAKADGEFPSGFEIVIAGPPGNRRVLARIVVAAKGNFKEFLAFERAASVAAQDAGAAAAK